MQDETIYKGNNAADYQPPTGNPQSTGGNIQQGSSGLQNSSQQGDITQQRLPSVDNLQVVIVQDTNSSSTAGLTPVQAATQTWIGPFWGCVILVIIGVIIWAVRVLAKEEVPDLPAVLEEAAKEPLIDMPVASAKPEPVKPTKSKNSAGKKAAGKKSTKKKSKRK